MIQFFEAEKLTSREWSCLGKSACLAIMRVGAVEQHGPHLPLGTDSMLGRELWRNTRQQLEEKNGCSGNPSGTVIILPEITYGTSTEHRDFPGTLSIRAVHLMDLIRDLAESVVRSGVRRLLLLNSHGGNAAILDQVALELRADTGLLVVATSWTRMVPPHAVFPSEESRRGIHGGAFETALMRAHCSNDVREADVRNFPLVRADRENGEDESNVPAITFGGRGGAAWMMSDLNPDGAVGDAELGTSEMGRRYSGLATAACADLVRSMIVTRTGKLVRERAAT